jgi:mannose-1-phosphate guanylyltransferase
MTVRSFSTAMVLAAGRGLRMRPLSDVLPKPALPLPDGPVVASALRLAAAAGATRVVVNSNHLGERMAEAVASVDIPAVEIMVSHEDELMGTAGGLALARERGLLGDRGPVLVVNGDGVLGLDLTGLAERHRDSGDLVTLALLPHLDPERWSRITLDVDGQVDAILPPGLPGELEAPFLYPGVMAVDRVALDALAVAPSEVPEALWGPARTAHRFGGTLLSGHWREVGTPNDYLEVMGVRLGGSNFIDPSAEIAATARVRNSFVGRRSVVAGGAMIESSIIAEGAVVESGARVDRCVLFGSVEVIANQEAVGSILARECSDAGRSNV